MRSWVSLLVFTVVLMRAGCSMLPTSNNHIYKSEWAVYLENGSAPDVLSDEYENLGPIANLPNWYLVRHKPTHKHNVRTRTFPVEPNNEVTDVLLSHPRVKSCMQQRAEPLKHQTVQFKDPLFSSQWHLDNTGQFGGTPGVDVNIMDAWNQGYSGNGVRIAFVDDGLQYDHPDLAEAYQADSSYDVNDNDTNPYPDVATDPHGTSVAGVAGARNNSVCGVGAAFSAELASIRLTAAPSTDAQRATALSYKYNSNDIFSSSFGPINTGQSVGARGTLTVAAMKDAVTNGRNGKGTIFVFAAGNGGQEGSNCNYNGFANAMEVIAVGALGNDGKKAYYGELCAAMLISAPSGNVDPTTGIRTTDLVGSSGYDSSDCTSSFSGTSSACPLVSGVIALMLEANPALTWRDVQAILATTAAMTDETDSDWVKNGAGLHVNHKYGFGRVDATAAVNAARTHKLLPAQAVASIKAQPNQPIPDYPGAGVSVSLVVGDEFPVERVVVTVYINHTASGDLGVKLLSPSGTESYLAYPHAEYSTILVAGTEQPITVGGAAFGPSLPYNATQYYYISVIDPSNACGSPSNCLSLSKTLALITTSSSCSIVQQVKFMQDCGAVGVLVISTLDSASDIALPAGADGSQISIPVVQVPSSVGKNLTINSRVALKQAKYAANDYQGWQFSSVRSWGESSKGNWSLLVTDGLPNDTGFFYAVQLDVYGARTANSTVNDSEDPPAAPPIPPATGPGKLDPEGTSSASFISRFPFLITIFVFFILA